MSDRTRVKRLHDLTVAGSRLVGPGETLVTDVVYDSRQVTPGALFVAMRGGYVDGHDYIDQAIARGAAALVVERARDAAVPQIVVDDSRAALATIAAEFFDHPSRQLNVVGVTGTDGKTSTSMLAEAMLARAGARTGLVGTVAIKIGDDIVDHETRQTTPESLDVQRLLREMVDRGVGWAFLEATSHGLEMHRLDHVRFAVAAVTNITHEHIDFHGTRDAYWRAKRRLFEMTRSVGGRAVVNLDDEGACSALDVCDADRTITYSTRERRAGLRAEAISLGRNGYSARFVAGDHQLEIASPLLGGFNVSNSLCAAGIAFQAGVDPAMIAATLAKPPVIPGRMATIDEGQGFSVVVDYAHTPASLEKVLSLLRALNPDGRLIVVTGSAGERDVEKRSLQGAVCARMADIAIFTNEDPRYEDAGSIVDQIAAGARLAGATDGNSIHCIVDRAAAIDHAIGLARPGDTVLLAGKGHERSIIINNSKLPWDEAEQARRAIRARARLERSA